VPDGTVAPAFLGPTSQVFAPYVAFAQVVSPALISANSNVFAPVISQSASGAQTVISAFLWSGSAVFSPVFSQPSSYDADSVAYFAAAGITDATRKGLIDTMVKGLKADGLWKKLDWLLVAGVASVEMRTNVRAPSKVASAINSPTYTVDRGFSGDGSTAYLDLGEVYNNTGNQWGQDNATIGVWCNLDAGASGIQAHCGR
jgi:hypothetical protein